MIGRLDLGRKGKGTEGKGREAKEPSSYPKILQKVIKGLKKT
jgi:hypothetical protein